MKKIIVFALSLFLFGTMIFAYDMSVGAGFVFGNVNDTWENYGTPDNRRDISFNRKQYGGFAFFGTKYTEFNCTVRLSRNEWERKWKTGEHAGEVDKMDPDTLLMLSVGAYGKYPFNLSESVMLFPTIGLDFDAVEGYTYLWFRGGAGLDLFFTERFFLRGQALYGYGIKPPLINRKEDTTVKPGHGALFKLGVGWMF